MRCYFCKKRNTDGCSCVMSQHGEPDNMFRLCINCYKNLLDGIETCREQASKANISRHVSMINSMTESDIAELISKGVNNEK